MKCTILIFILFLSGCVVLPTDDNTYVNKCEISSDRKTLKVVSASEGLNTFYSISDLLLLPVTGVIVGIYVGVNNIYHLGEEKIVCG
ncbi:MAG: hypothetical protein HRT54_22160 [Colwellia sp.]|nr:hypothetical protein [Colwellia sp.]